MTPDLTAKQLDEYRYQIAKRGVPDLERVRHTVHTKAQAIFQAGTAVEGSRVWSKTLKHWVYVRRAPTPGQIVKVSSPNIQVIVEPQWSDDELTVIEYGCTHDFETVAQRNCYHEARCTKCGFHYGVDSSD